MLVTKRDGSLVPFDQEKILVAVTTAFLKDANGEARETTSEDSAAVRAKSEKITDQVVSALERFGLDGSVHIEDIQDQVELALMRSGEQKVARDYVLYRERQAQKRTAVEKAPQADAFALMGINVLKTDGSLAEVNDIRMKKVIEDACQDLGWQVDPEPVWQRTTKLLYDGMTEEELGKAPILASRTLVERDPNYAYAAAALLLDVIRHEALGKYTNQEQMTEEYPAYFADYIRMGIYIGRLDPRLAEFDLDMLGKAIVPDLDKRFEYQGMQILADRYLIHENGRRIELPQAMWMRVAMGLAINEVYREKRAIEFYGVLSTFRFVSSTPTLFNSGTVHPQLSSCYLTTVPDDLDGIYESIKENALLSKFAGGLGNDWTRVRSLGSYIKGTNGKSQGVVPFLKVVNDTAVAVNQGGKRKGAVCAYLETWHLDIEEFLELRKNTGDDRRRTHDMNTANWVPDLFMQRVEANAEWTLFSPSEVPDLHDLYGAAFQERYEEYERMADAGQITLYKRISAVQLWRKMLTMLFETGHPWITFKDPCNLRSPQRHVGVVHSSNLCTEITLNSSDSETAVCNLGSVNLMEHLVSNPVYAKEGDEAFQEDLELGELREEFGNAGALRYIDMGRLQDTIRTAMRMLDNVIDINFYPHQKARIANLQHRAVGLGVMGFADSLAKLRVPMDSLAAVAFAGTTQEVISYCAIDASADLAQERGSYSSFPGSDWDWGILPIDTVFRVFDSRGTEATVNLDGGIHPAMWGDLRTKVKKGMRNSNCMAIAPTATISNIVGVSQGIDPIYQNLYVKSNLSGDFTVVNRQMVEDLDRLGLWDEVMVNDLKYFDGSLVKIDRVPAWMKRLYATAFEIDPQWLIAQTAMRQKWVDQSISLNLYMADPSGKKLDELYRLAWKMGLKTTYYLRSVGATSAEKSTVSQGTLNAVEAQPKVCLLDDPSCESCQ